MGKKHVMIELRCPKTLTTKDKWKVYADKYMKGFTGLNYDSDYGPIPVKYRKFPEIAAKNFDPAKERLIVVRGIIDESSIEDLERQHVVIKAWSDPRIRHLSPPAGRAPCGAPDPGSTPCGGTCYTSSYSPIGTIADVTRYLDAGWFWAKYIRGQNVVIGIVDTGVKKCYIGEKLKTKNDGTIDGWPEDMPNIPPPGADWNVWQHGSMCAYNALNISPDALILDIGVIKIPGLYENRLSNAKAAYDWALNRYLASKEAGTNEGPHILSNSWACMSGDEHITGVGHVFWAKLEEVIEAGILVCFAAGNCGALEPNSACGSSGPGQSIWGPAAHKQVVTVGAAVLPNGGVNQPRWWGGSSQGPSPDEPEKPDIVVPSTFTGLTYCDAGTSAATGVAAGILALLICAAVENGQPPPTQDEVLRTLRDSAKQLCGVPNGTHSGHTGYGMVDPVEAFKKLMLNFRSIPVGSPIVKDPSAGQRSDLSMERLTIPGSYTCPPCVIATAAFGSTIHPQVEFLRNYRDDVIIRSTFAPSFKRLLKLYYKFSPPVARKMEQSSGLKNAIKAAIVYPFVGFLKGLVFFGEFVRTIRKKLFK